MSQIGRVGELFTMYQLERRGVQAVHVDREEIDLWVRTPTGRVLTVQVKTASCVRRETINAAEIYRFFLPKNATCDLIALVALDAEVVVFCPPSETSSYVPATRMTAEGMERSIAEHLA